MTHRAPHKVYKSESGRVCDADEAQPHVPIRHCCCCASIALSTLLIRAMRLSSKACPESTSFTATTTHTHARTHTHTHSDTRVTHGLVSHQATERDNVESSELRCTDTGHGCLEALCVGGCGRVAGQHTISIIDRLSHQRPERRSEVPDLELA
jgi:hypothetical protein